MATHELGFISVPISPTFAGIAGKLQSQLIKPARDAGRKAATEVEKSVEASVKSLERQVSASTKKLGQLDRAHQDSIQKRESQQHKLNAAIAEQEVAEEKYQAVLKKGGSATAELAKLEKAKAKVTDETIKMAKAERDIVDAEQKHKAQLDDLQRTTEKYGKAQADLNNEVGKSKGVFSGLRDSFKGLGDQVSSMPGPIGSIGETLSAFKGGPTAGVMAVAGALAAATGAVGKFNENLTQSRVSMQNQFGLSADAARDMQGEIAEALGSGLGDYETTAMAVTQIAQVWGDEIAHMGGQTAAQLADDFMAFNSTFERSAEETASTVDVMLNSGLVASGQEGLDLLTAGMQKVPLAMQDEVFDAMNEYTKNFANLGISGSDAMAMLVDAAENGQYAIDKTGDAIKEFSVLAIDPAKEEAFEAIGLNAEHMATAVAGGGDSAAAALRDAAQGLLDIEDPGKRAALAVELFGAPIEDLGVDQIPDFLDSLTAGSDGMGDFAGSAQNMADNTTRTFTGMFNSWKGRLHGWAIDSTIRLNEWTGEAADAIVNSDFVERVGGVFNEVKELGSGVRDILFEGDYTGLPFGLGEDSAVVDFLFDVRETVIETKDTAIAAWDELTAAFTGGDWGYGALAELIGEEKAQDLVDMLAEWGERVREFRDVVSEGFSDIWEAVEPVLSWLQEFASDHLSGALEDLWGALESVGSAFGSIAESVGGALWDALQGAWELFKALWDLLSPLLIPILKIVAGIAGGVLVGAFMLLIGAVRVAAEIIEDLASVIQWVAENVLSPLIGQVGDVARMFYEVLAGALSALGDYWSNIFSGISQIWDGFTTLLGIGKDFIVATIFGGLGAGLDVVRDSFGTAVEAIGKIWDGLKEIAAAPVRFVVETVWNNGLLKAVEAIAGFIPGLDAPDPIKLGFARGGILPGWSRMADGDDQLVPMRRGEGVLVSEGLQDQTSRRLFLAANEEAKQGKSFAQFLEDYVAGYANGGIVGSLNSIMKEFYPELQLTSHFRPGDSGYHGKNMAADFSNTGAGMPSTPAMQAAARFMFANYGDQLEQLIHHPARNIGSGMDVGDGFGYYGAATMYGHTDHIHLAALQPLVDPSGVVQMVPFDGGGGGWFNPLAAAKSLWDAVVNKISPFKDDGGWFSQVPGAFLSHVGGLLWDFVAGKMGAGSYDGAGGSIGNAESWRDMAVAAMRRNGFNADDPAQVNAMLAQIMSESSGDPSAVQGVIDVNSGGNEAVGLLQVIPGTFAAHRDPSLPNDRTDPWANMNAALRYYRSKYGTDLTTMWGKGHGYADGGIVDLFTRDLGGWVPSGALVRNTSGRDELMLPPGLSQAMAGFFADYPAAAEMLEAAAEHIDSAAEWLTKAADFASEEGVTGRQVVRQVFDLGIDLPGSGMVTGFLDAEAELWALRTRHIGHLDTLTEKEKALEEARKALSDLEADEGGMSKSDRRKLEDAQKALDAAKAEEIKGKTEDAKAESAAKRAEKIAKAEEKLARIREDIDDNAVSAAEKRADEITKANAAVVKAEEELAEARAAMVKDLDHIVLFDQQSVESLIPQVEGLAAQLIGLGAPAAVVSQGLGGIVAGLGGIASLAGPAGFSLGMALEALKVVIQLVQMVDAFIKEIVSQVTTYRVAREQAFSDYAANIQQINALVTDQKRLVVDLSTAWVEASLAMADATRAVTAATAGVFQAALDGAKGIAAVQQKIRDARTSTGGGGGGGSSSGEVPWDMGLLYDSYANELTATPRVKSTSTGATTRDVVNGLKDVAALQEELLAAEINAQVLMMQATLDLLNAQYEQTTAQIALIRLEEDLLRQIRHLNSLQEIQVQFAMNEQQAILAQAYADMAMKVAEAEATTMDLGNRIGALLDLDGDGKVFGLFTNVGSASMQAAEAQKAAARAQMEAIEKMAGPYGGLPQMGDLEKTIDQVARLTAAGEDAAAAMAMWGSALGDPARMLQITELETTLRTVDENNLNLTRSIEDMNRWLQHLEKTIPLQEEIFSLEHERDAHLAAAEALRATSADVKAAAEALRDFHLEAANMKPQEVTMTVVIPSRGQMVDPEDIRDGFRQLNQQLTGLGFRIELMESNARTGANAVLATKK